MKGSFMKRGRQCDVTVTMTHLKCKLRNSFGPNISLEINLSDVLAVHTIARDNGNVSSVIVHYAGHKKDKTLTWEKLVLSGEPELCKELNNVFSLTCPGRQRNKHFIVVINPRGGKRQGRRIFHKKVAPLFRACNITFKVYETTGPRDVDPAFHDVDLNAIDGVVCVGGDGTYSEIITALISKQQQALGQSVDDPDQQLQPLPFPVGIIPGGSGNYVCRFLHQTTDPVTAAVKIVLGETTPTNVSSLHQAGKLEMYCGLLVSFGLIGEMIHNCEKHRWMGNTRYKIIPLKTIFSRKLIEADVEYLKESDGTWERVKDQVYVVDNYVVDLVDKDAKMKPKFGDSAMTLHVTSACPFGDHIKQLTKVADWVAGAWGYDFIKCERVLRYRIHLNTPTTVTDGVESLTNQYYINADGEGLLVHTPTVEVGLHTGIVRLFGVVEP